MNRRWFLQWSAFLPFGFRPAEPKPEKPKIGFVMVEAWADSLFNDSLLPIPGFIASHVGPSEGDIVFASGPTEDKAIENFKTLYASSIGPDTVFKIVEHTPVLSPFELVQQELEHWKGKTWEQLSARYAKEKAILKASPPTSRSRHWNSWDSLTNLQVLRESVLLRVGLSPNEYLLSFGVEATNGGSRLGDDVILHGCSHLALYRSIKTYTMPYHTGSWLPVE